MRQLDENLWVHEDVEDPMLRMTVVRLSDGNLWVHSPTPISVDVKSEIDALGAVSTIVAPNNHHHRSFLQWTQTFPDAQAVVARGIPEKLSELCDYQFIDDVVASGAWADDLDVAVMEGVSLFGECDFFHRSSRSLVVTDLVQNYSGTVPQVMLYPVLFKPLGYKGIILAPPLRFDWIVEDREALDEFINQIKSWPFERIIVTHGDIIEANGRQVFTDICTQRFEEKGSRLNELAMKLFIRAFGS